MESSNITLLSFEDACRVCMGKKGVFVDIFNCQNRNIPEEILYCSGILINVEDTLSPYICVQCVKELSVACNFKRKCVEADVFRRLLITSNDNDCDYHFDYPTTILNIQEEIDTENSEIKLSPEQELETHLQLNDTAEDIMNLSEDINNWPSVNVEIYSSPHCTKNMTNKGTEGEIKTNIDSNHKHQDDIQLKDKVSLKKFLCTTCNTEFENDNDLEKHKLKVHKTKFTCKTCSKVFGSLSILSSHIRMHKPSVYGCKICNYKTVSHSCLLTHLMTHSGTVKYTCDYCKRQFSLEKNLSEHICQNHWNAMKNYICSACNKRFHSLSKLKCHLLLHSQAKSPEQELETHLQLNDTAEDIMNLSEDINNWPSVNVEIYSSPHCTKNMTSKGPEGEIKTNIDSNHKHQDDIQLKDKVILKKFLCTTCNTEFENDNDLAKHKLKVHETNFICKICSEVFGSLSSLSNHNRMHKSSVYGCKICNFNTVSHSCLITHLMTHSGTVKYTCDYCKHPFTNKQNLSEHIRQNHWNATKIYVCSPCNQRFHSLSNLKCHLLLHSQAKSYYACYKCPRKYLHFSNYRHHMIVKHGVSLMKSAKQKDFRPNDEIEHPKPKIVNRPEIFKQSKVGLQEHDYIKMQTTNVDQNGKKCDKIIDVKNYESTLTPVPPQYKVKPIVRNCLKCGLRFEDKNMYRRHVYKVHDSVKCTCELCGNVLGSRGALKVHIRETHKCPSFNCKICDYNTKNYSCLIIHMNTHSGGATYKCDYCQYETPVKSNLVVHIRRKHTVGAIKKQCCSICNKRFHTKSDMKRHLVVHSRRKRFSCDKCLRKYRHYPNYRQHMIVKHNAPYLKVPKKVPISGDRATAKTSKILTQDSMQDRNNIEMQTYKKELTDTKDKGFNSTNKNQSQTDSQNIEIVKTKGQTSSLKPKSVQIEKWQNSLKLIEKAIKPKVAKLPYFTCTICKIRFDDAIAKRKHAHEVHKQIRTCEVCGKQYSNYSIASHMRTHRDPKFFCNYCSYKTSNKTCLSKHMNVHSGEFKFQCDHCKRIFSFKSNLLLHIRNMHLKNVVKKHSCHICFKKFSVRQILEQHVKGHLQVKGFSCDHCSSSFIHRRHYKKHLQLQHNVILPALTPGKKPANIKET